MFRDVRTAFNGTASGDAAALIISVGLQILAGIYSASLSRAESPAFGLPAQLTLTEAFKLAISLGLHYVTNSQKRYGHLHNSSDPWGPELDDQRQLQDGGSKYPGRLLAERVKSWSVERLQLQPSVVASSASLAFLAAMYGLRSYVAFGLSSFVDPLIMHSTSIPVPLLTALVAYWLCTRTVSVLSVYSLLIQACGLFILQDWSSLPALPAAPYLFVFGLSLLTSLLFVFNEQLYKTHSISFSHQLNIILFASGFMLHFLIAILQFAFGSAKQSLYPSTSLSLKSFVPLLLRASADVALINLILRYDAIVTGVASSFSAAILGLIYGAFHLSHSFASLGGSCLAIFGSAAYMKHRVDSQEEAKAQTSVVISASRRKVLATVLALVLSVQCLGFFALRNWYEEIYIKPSGPAIFADLAFLPPRDRSTCSRKDLPSLKYYPNPRTYHEFDDVLLIVFFSHARYDVNLDYYKEVYSEFFPNMVFVGPASREDAGFEHSYDVIVDSYQADEDLDDPNFFKMAGRMAHHMLYTVMKDHDCYAGYLWAPFDTFLNVPRLQQFRKDRFWYHSPFAEYVPNPRLGPDGADPKLHSPTLNISPDPVLLRQETYRGWREDWWWGEPHVGIDVCMPAFVKVSAERRDRLAALTNGTRFIGGSVDTLYIPGHLREDFLDTLGLFLGTNCFLEIAVPTTVHLIVPPEETIQFVDHWWVWRPPFNATFVRNTWAAGMEVDTFHTFHWGDRGADGVWRGIPENIAGVRHILQDSARVQGFAP